MTETRRDHRAPIALKIRYKSASVDEFAEQYAADISRGGVFIKSKSPLDVGTLLKFELQLKDETELVAGVGRVVWIRKLEDAYEDHPAGMGIKFVKMDGQSRSFVEDLVNKRGTDLGRFDQGSTDVTPAKGIKLPAGEPEAVAPEDRSDLRNTSELLASAIAEAGVGGETANEALEQGEKAFRKSQEATGSVSLPAADEASGASPGAEAQASKKGSALPLAVAALVLGLVGGGYFVFAGGGEPNAEVTEAPRPAPIEAEPAAHVPEPEPEAVEEEPEAAEEPEAEAPAAPAYRVTIVTEPPGAKVTVGKQEVLSPGELTFDERPKAMDVSAVLAGHRSAYIRLRPSEFAETDGNYEARIVLTLKPRGAAAAPQPTNAAEPKAPEAAPPAAKPESTKPEPTKPEPEPKAAAAPKAEAKAEAELKAEPAP
jgi:uncharacterized protein (TIGR02266 family)